MCLTPEKCLGGTAWPNIIPHNERHEIPLLAMGQLDTGATDALVEGNSPAGGEVENHRSLLFPTFQCLTRAP